MVVQRVEYDWRAGDLVQPQHSIEPKTVLVVLDRDYFAIPDVDIRKIRAMLTIVDGKVVHERT